MFRVRFGFTLIELLVVMALIGVLASVVIVAVNPLEQLAKSRDTARISAIAQLGGALESYHTSTNGQFPQESTTWMDTLAGHGDLRGFPVNPEYLSGTSCNNGASIGQNGYCYKTGEDTIIYSQLEATSNNKNCASSSDSRAYFVYSYKNARSCGVCGQDTTDPDSSSISCDF